MKYGHDKLLRKPARAAKFPVAKAIRDRLAQPCEAAAIRQLEVHIQQVLDRAAARGSHCSQQRRKSFLRSGASKTQPDGTMQNSGQSHTKQPRKEQARARPAAADRKNDPKKGHEK